MFAAGHHAGKWSAEAFQDGSPREKAPRLGVMALQHLRGEVVCDVAVAARELPEESVWVRMVAEGKCGQVEAGGPSLRAFYQDPHIPRLESIFTLAASNAPASTGVKRRSPACSCPTTPPALGTGPGGAAGPSACRKRGVHSTAFVPRRATAAGGNGARAPDIVVQHQDQRVIEARQSIHQARESSGGRIGSRGPQCREDCSSETGLDAPHRLTT